MDDRVPVGSEKPNGVCEDESLAAQHQSAGSKRPSGRAKTAARHVQDTGTPGASKECKPTARGRRGAKASGGVARKPVQRTSRKKNQKMPSTGDNL